MLLGFTVVILVLFLGVLGLQTLFNWIINFLSYCLNLKKHALVSKLVVSLFIGLSVWVIWTPFKDAPWFQDIEDAGLDLAVQVSQEPATTKDISYVFLDIDAQTHQLWGEPLLTPRNKVKELIEVAVNGGARLVIVDVDLSRRTPADKKVNKKVNESQSDQTSGSTSGLQNLFFSLNQLAYQWLKKEYQHPDDKALNDYLADYKNHCLKERCPPIILNKAFRSMPESAYQELLPKPRSSFLDDAIAESAHYVLWASPMFQPSSFDGAIKHSRLWRCTDQKNPEVIPSIQLLAAALIRHQTPQSALEQQINAVLDKFHQSCPPSESSNPIEFADGLVFTDDQQRIRYRMRWQPPTNIANDWTMRYSQRESDKGTQKGRVKLTVFSAQPYLDLKPTNRADTLTKKIVIIGSSYSSQGTMPNTPLGSMPNGLVMINAIHSLLQLDGNKLTSGLEQSIWTISLIAVVSLILTFVESFWIVALTGIGVVILVLVGSFWLLEDIWLNLALALLAIHIHQIAASYRDKTIKLKWREQKLKQKLAKEVEQSLANKLDELAEIEQQLTKKIGEIKDFATNGSSNKTDSESATEPQKNDGAILFLSVPHNRYQRIAKSFSRWPTLARVMTINLVVGLTIALILQGGSSWLGLIDAEEANLDFWMEINQNFIPPIQKNDVPSTVFLDIDDATHSEWGKPMLIPRRRIKNLIKAAVEAKAKLIMVNIDLTRPTPIDGAALHSDDQALKDYLVKYASNCKSNQSCPWIILKRSFSTEKSPIPIVRESFLDEVVKNGAPYLRWASTLFEPDEDQVVRWTQLWQSACTNNEEALVVPSLELLAMAHVKSCTTELQRLDSFSPIDCHSDYVPKFEKIPDVCGGLHNSTESGDINNRRIMYRMPWLVDDEPPHLPYALEDESNKPVLDILSARPYAEESPPQASLEPLKDKIVVIGGSYSDGRDIYSTPLGKMPGTLILVNALYSLLQQNDFPDLPSPLIDLLARLLIMAVFIVVISFLFVFFRSVWGMLFWGIVVIFGLLPMAMVFLYYGTSLWPYFAVPLMVIFIYLALLAAAWKPEVAQKTADIDK